nr:MAG TPA: hypothetical protein [Caudoviricetes sp.]
MLVTALTFSTELIKFSLIIKCLNILFNLFL